jgi:hypothetical protein
MGVRDDGCNDARSRRKREEFRGRDFRPKQARNALLCFVFCLCFFSNGKEEAMAHGIYASHVWFSESELGVSFGGISLTAGEASSLAEEIEAKWPDLAKELAEVASGVYHMARFDGPLGSVDHMPAQPGNYERAQQMIAALDVA